jgi:hypothetical protein
MAYGAEIWTWNKRHKNINAAETIKKHTYTGMTQTRTLQITKTKTIIIIIIIIIF